MSRDQRKNTLQIPYVWAFTTYFAEGFPYTIIRIVSSVFFRDIHVSLQAIGLTSLFGLPWILKFLWGPQVDQYGTKRRWMLMMQFLLLVVIVAVSFLVPLPFGVRFIAVAFFVGAIIAATHDIAIDGYYMEALDESGQAKFVGYRVMAYRIAMMTGTGIIVTVGTTVNWVTGFMLAAGLLAILFFYHLLLLPRVEEEKRPIMDLIQGFFSLRLLSGLIFLAAAIITVRWVFSLGWYQQVRHALPIFDSIRFSGWVGIGVLVVLILLAIFKDRIKGFLLRDKDSFYSRAFMSYMDREKIGVALAFIILMRTGDSMLASMAAPFMVDLGIKVHYGWISGMVGLPCSIVGALVGGWLISRYTLRRTILPFLLAQNLTNVIYMLLALSLNEYIILNTGADVVTSLGNLNLSLVGLVHGFDQFAGGLGTATLMIFLMRTCLPQFKAAHFAIGSGLMNISGVLSGVMSGFLAEWLGYGYFFGISFLASLPGMSLLFFIPFLESPADSKGHD